MPNQIEGYRIVESVGIEARLNDARDAMQRLVAEQRVLLPVALMSNGYSNETPETAELNRALSDLWNVLDLYSDVQYNRMATTMALMDTKEKLEREQERSNEQRERAEEAEELLAAYEGRL